MIRLKRNGMRVLKFFHLLAAASWFGGSLSLVMLIIFFSHAHTDDMLLGMSYASHMIDISVVIIPGSMGCLITGCLYALLTPWKFFKWNWIIMKWIITIGAIMVGIFFLSTWESRILEFAGEIGLASWDSKEFIATRFKLLSFASIQTLALAFAFLISIFKPWGKRNS